MGSIVALMVLAVYLAVRLPAQAITRHKGTTAGDVVRPYSLGVTVTTRRTETAGQCEAQTADRPLRVGGELWSTPVVFPVGVPRGEVYVPQAPAHRPIRATRPSPPPLDPLIGMLTSLKYTRGQAVAWAAQVQGETLEERMTEVFRRHGDLLLQVRKQKAGMPSTATLTALVRQGCEKTAQEVATEQGIDSDAVDAELDEIRAHAEGAEDLGTGTLIVDENTGEVMHRIGSGLPAWLQDRGGSKAILTALDKRSGKLWDDLNMLAIDRARETVPF